LCVQGRLGSLDLVVGEIVDQDAYPGEGQLDGLELSRGVFRHDAQVGPQLLVGVRVHVVIGHPAGIGKHRHRYGDRGDHHHFQEANRGVAAGAHWGITRSTGVRLSDLIGKVILWKEVKIPHGWRG